MAETARKSRFAHTLIGVIIALAFIVGALYAAYLYFDSPLQGADAGEVIFTVPKGASVSGVAEELERKGLARSALFLTIYARIHDSGLIAGSYRLSPSMKSSEIWNRLVDITQQSAQRLMITEGMTMRAIARLLDEHSICSEADFLAACADPELLSTLGVPGASAEGFLMPDTYFLSVGSSARDLVRTFVANFFKAYDSIVSARPSQDELLRQVILASIVEREYRLPDEAPLIADVFENRIKIGMRLQSCATIVYIITERLGKPHPSYITYDDLEIKDDYNTYKIKGLPPGPISNPGKVALEAAIRPARTPYLYFRLIDEATGRHKFSKSLEEHNSGPSLWIKSGR